MSSGPTRTLSEVTSEPLYAHHKKVYPRLLRGRYSYLRGISTLALLGLYYVIPWIVINDQPLVHFDLPARRFHIFFFTLVPQDLFLLTWLLIIAAVTLFFFTNLGGRLWCGYACPQTVWTKTFLWMEEWVEGNRSKRMKLDHGPWTLEKVLRRGGKHLLWISFALWTGFTFVAYFTPAHELLDHVLQSTLGPWEQFWILFYGFATYGNGGLMREQVCKYMCPYARFQSAMFDKDTLIISYDEARGEPRMSAKKAKKHEGNAGDCVDCTLCVQVCPVGIDIRDGLQYECIACAACIDACDSVMEHLQRPRGLVRYTTHHALNGQTSRLIRPRTIAYGIIWAGLCLGLLVALFLRSPLQLDVIRDRNALYQSVHNAETGPAFENVYTVHLTNKSDDPQQFQLSLNGMEGAVFHPPVDNFTIDGRGKQQIPVRIRVPSASLNPGVNNIDIVATRLNEDDKASAKTRARFFAPFDLRKEGTP